MEGLVAHDRSCLELVSEGGEGGSERVNETIVVHYASQEQNLLFHSVCSPLQAALVPMYVHVPQKSFFSEVCRLARLILVMPAMNTVSERSFSDMRRLVCQSRLNHVMLLSINREKVDQLDIDVIADDFVQGSEHRLPQFGKFTATS